MRNFAKIRLNLLVFALTSMNCVVQQISAMDLGLAAFTVQGVVTELDFRNTHQTADLLDELQPVAAEFSKNFEKANADTPNISDMLAAVMQLMLKIGDRKDIDENKSVFLATALLSKFFSNGDVRESMESFSDLIALCFKKADCSPEFITLACTFALNGLKTEAFLSANDLLVLIVSQALKTKTRPKILAMLAQFFYTIARTDSNEPAYLDGFLQLGVSVINEMKRCAATPIADHHELVHSSTIVAVLPELAGRGALSTSSDHDAPDEFDEFVDWLEARSQGYACLAGLLELAFLKNCSDLFGDKSTRNAVVASLMATADSLLVEGKEDLDLTPNGDYNGAYSMLEGVLRHLAPAAVPA